MKKLSALVALLMASTAAAHAGNSISFEIEGQKIRIEAAKNCDSLSCIKISAPGMSGSGFNLKGFKGFKGFGNDDAAEDNSNPPPAQTTAPAPIARVSAPQPAAPVMNSAGPAPTTVATTAPITPAPAPVANTVAPVAAAAVATVAPAPAPVAQTPAAASVTPIGVWATEDNKGRVRIEQCGANLCGYADKTGEKILISMKPAGAKWTGQIHDPDSGRDYDSTIALKGANALEVQGCALGGLFCGGQSWKRVR